MLKQLHTALITFTLIASGVAMESVSLAQDREPPRESPRENQSPAAVRYHDKAHNDDHEWNNREDRAYRMWLQDRHRKDVEFNRLNRGDQQTYWNWRHNHSDAELKIDVR